MNFQERLKTFFSIFSSPMASLPSTPNLTFITNISSKSNISDLYITKNKFSIAFGTLRTQSSRALIKIQAMGSSSSSQKPESTQEMGKVDYRSVSDDEWQKRLTKDQFYVTRKKGTERAFTGEYWNTKTSGIYHCVCCDTPLYESSTKFDSGTGWPSYYQPIGNNVKSKMDLSIIFMPREEVLCSTCDAHLGHVFNDGPPPTGKRHCINSASLKLKPHSDSEN